MAKKPAKFEVALKNKKIWIKVWKNNKKGGWYIDKAFDYSYGGKFSINAVGKDIWKDLKKTVNAYIK